MAIKYVLNIHTGKFDATSVEDLSGYVPYTGATGNVDLGTHNATVGGLEVNGTSLFMMPDNTANAFGIGEGTNPYMCIDTTNGSEIIKFGCGLGANDIFTIQPTLITLGRNTDLGTYNLTTTGLATLGSIKSGILYPSADSTTAVQIRKADGATNVLNVDTTNSRVGIGTTGPVTRLDLGDNLTTNSQLKVGTFEVQSYATNNAFFGDNVYYSGNFKARAAGYTSVMTWYSAGFESRVNPNLYAAGDTAGAGFIRPFRLNPDGSVALGGNLTGTGAAPLNTLTGAAMVISTTGNVGIGTTSPGSLLHIVGQSPMLTIADSDNAERSIKLGILTSDNEYPGIWLGQSTPDLSNYSFLGGGGYAIFNAAAGRYIDFRINNVYTPSAMRIASDGNVGIGTTAPGEKLEVTGNIKLTSDNNILKFGTGEDASIYYDATNLIINPKEVGSGEVEVKGNVDMDFNDIKDANQVEVAGYIELPEDGGICLLTDLPQNTAVLNTEQSYSFQIGGEELLKLKSLSDGAGGIKDKTVSVDAALEANSIATFSINAVCNNNEVICHNNEVIFS
jgi:hypothetical protein